MKKTLILLTAALAFGLSACSHAAVPVSASPPAPVTLQTTDYLFVVGATSTDVLVKSGHVGTQFCFTDEGVLKNTLVCHNHAVGKRTVSFGSASQVSFFVTESGKRIPAQ